MEEYITIKEASKICSLTVTALYQRVKRGSIRGKKIGWIWLILKSDLCSLKPNHKTRIK